MERRHRRAGAAVVLAASVSAILACGIPSVGFVAGPPQDSVGRSDLETLPRITFSHDADLNDTDDFKGYDLYYRLYDDAAEEPTYEEHREAILADPPEPGTSRLRANGYRRVVSAEEATVDGQVPPLIAVPPEQKDDAFDVTLSFGLIPTEPEEATAVWLADTETPGSAPLARSVEQEGTQAPEGFLLGTYQDADQDVSHISRPIETVIDESYLFVALYALGYGIDGLTFQRIYSEPVFLEYFRLTPAE